MDTLTLMTGLAAWTAEAWHAAGSVLTLSARRGEDLEAVRKQVAEEDLEDLERLIVDAVEHAPVAYRATALLVATCALTATVAPSHPATATARKRLLLPYVIGARVAGRN